MRLLPLPVTVFLSAAALAVVPVAVLTPASSAAAPTSGYATTKITPTPTPSRASSDKDPAAKSGAEDTSGSESAGKPGSKPEGMAEEESTTSGAQGAECPCESLQESDQQSSATQGEDVPSVTEPTLDPGGQIDSTRADPVEEPDTVQPVKKQKSDAPGVQAQLRKFLQDLYELLRMFTGE